MTFLYVFGVLLTAVSFLASSYVSGVVLHRPSLTPLAAFASLAVFSQGIIQSVTSGLVGWNAMKSVSIVNVTQALLKLVVATALVVLGLGVFGALVGLIASYSTAGGIAVFLLHSATSGTGSEDGGFFGMLTQDILTMLRYGLPHYIGSLVSVLALQYVTVLLALVASNVVVGYYQSASNVLVAVTLTSSAVTLTLFPAFARLQGIGADTALALTYSVKYTSLIIAPIILFLVGAAGPIMRTLYGPSFSSANLYLVLLCISNLPILLGLPIFPSFFSGVGRTRLSMYFFFVQAVTQLALAILLGVSLGLGVPGLIFSIMLSNLSATLLGLYFSRRIFGAAIDASALLSILFASLVSLVTILPFRTVGPSWLALIADIAVYLLAYLTMAPLVGAIHKDDVVRLGIATGEMGAYSRIFVLLLNYEDKILKLRYPSGDSRPSTST